MERGKTELDWSDSIHIMELNDNFELWLRQFLNKNSVSSVTRNGNSQGLDQTKLFPEPEISILVITVTCLTL